MDQFRFRPRVDGLEDRHTPAVSPTQIFTDLAAIQADAGFMSALNAHPEYLVNGTYVPFVAGMLTVINQRQEVAAAHLADFQAALQANVANNPALAPTLAPAIQQVAAARFQASTTATVAQLDLNYLYDTLGFRPARPVSPAPVPPPTPSPPPVTTNVTDDSGMSNTVPDITNAAFQTASNGLRTRDVSVGTGEPAAAGDAVQVYYTGYLTNGTVFDSVRSPSQPAEFTLDNSVIPGFAQGIIGMQPGGVRQIVIPPELGYGASGQGSVPPNSTLIFEVKLISTTPPTA